MSSLLDGIDVGEKGGKKSGGGGGGPNTKVIKGAAAAVLFLVAGVIFAIQLDIIPNPFSSKSTKNSRGEVVEVTSQSPEEIERQRKIFEQEEQEHIRRGGQVGGA